MITTRRAFLKDVATLSVVSPALGALPLDAQTRPGSPVFAYVGTYSAPGSGAGRGIHIFQFDPQSGTLTERGVLATPTNPSWISINAAGTHLYAANELSNFEGNNGSVTAYAIDRATGGLTALNTVSSGAAGPAHMSLHPGGKHAFVANYGGGATAVLPILPNGQLGPATDIKKHEGTVGPKNAASAPPGSFAISGHERPHAHMVQADPSGRYVLAADLALDQIFVWKFDATTGTLTPNDPPFVKVPPGDGPRHFVFHPNGQWFFSLQEEGSTVMVFSYDAAAGRLTPTQTIATLPKGFAGTNFTSEIVLSPDGKFLYVANRLHDTIACFAVSATGVLTAIGEEPTRGDYPRHIALAPGGGFRYASNQRSDAVVRFRVDEQTGRLTYSGQYTAVGAPAIVAFLA